MADPSLIDVFINVQPDPELLQASEAKLEETANKIRKMFGDLHSDVIRQSKDAANQLSSINATPPGGGTGTGGAGGGAGGGRATPGGGAATGGLIQEFNEAKRRAEDLMTQVIRMQTILKDVDDDNLQNTFKLAKNELRDMMTELARFRQDIRFNEEQENIDNLRLSTERFLSVQERLNQASTGTSSARKAAAVKADLKAEFDYIVALEKREASEERIRFKYAESRIRGSGTAREKEELLQVREEAERAARAFDILSSKFDGTTVSVIRLQQAQVKLREAREAVADNQAILTRTGASFNTLSNNAYQLGQAFEDAAIGYQLNGISGAVRGASNNVAFLLNSLAQIPNLQDKVGERLSKAIPLAAGIGSALAILVVPTVAEWLETLNDIDAKTEDISKRLQQSFKNAEFRFSVREDQTATEEAIRGTTDAIRQIEQIADTARESQKLRRSVISSILAPDQNEVNEVVSQASQIFLQASREVADLNEEIRDRQSQLRGVLSSDGPDPLSGGVGYVSEPEIRETIAALEKEKDSMLEVQSAAVLIAKTLEDIREQARNGIIPTDLILKSAEAARTLTAEFDLFKKKNKEGFFSTKLAEEDVANIEKVISAQAAAVEEQAEALLRSQNLTKDALSAIVEQSGVILRRQQIERGVLEGRRTESDLFLFDLDQQNAKLQDQIDLIRETATAQGLTGSEVNAAARALRERQVENSLLEIDKRRNEIQKDRNRLLDEEFDKKSRVTDFEKYAQEIQTNVLSQTSEEQNKLEEVRQLEAEYRKLGEVRRRAFLGLPAGDILSYDESILKQAQAPAVEVQFMTDLTNRLELWLGESVRAQKEVVKAIENKDERARAN